MLMCRVQLQCDMWINATLDEFGRESALMNMNRDGWTLYYIKQYLDLLGQTAARCSSQCFLEGRVCLCVALSCSVICGLMRLQMSSEEKVR